MAATYSLSVTVLPLAVLYMRRSFNLSRFIPKPSYAPNLSVMPKSAKNFSYAARSLSIHLESSEIIFFSSVLAISAS